MNFDAVIFDFDGTLVDTLPMHYDAYRRTFAESNIELTPNDFYSNLGGNALEAIPKFLRGRETTATVTELHHRKKQMIRRSFTEDSVKVLESAKLLPLLHGYVPLALASSGSREGIEILLHRLDWRRYFSVVVTGEDVSSGKPAPDLFLLAAQELNVAPDRCFVFEDTDAGVEAARRAGMDVFDVRATTGNGRIGAR